MKSLEIALRGMQHRRCLDLFARDGSMVTSTFAPMVDELVGVDIDSEYLAAYRKRFGDKAITVQGDSVALMQSGVFAQAFDMVIVDNPQGIYGRGYVEHFDFFELLPRVMERSATLIFITNLCPHSRLKSGLDDYGMTSDDMAKWSMSRDWWYQTKADYLCQDFVVSHYLKRLWGMRLRGWWMGDYLRPSAVEGHPDHIYYMAFNCQCR